jgi:hypothetical protein
MTEVTGKHGELMNPLQLFKMLSWNHVIVKACDELPSLSSWIPQVFSWGRLESAGLGWAWLCPPEKLKEVLRLLVGGAMLSRPQAAWTLVGWPLLTRTHFQQLVG